MEPVNWGIISTAMIGVERVIPAMQQGELSRIRAIASRDLATARRAGDSLGIPKAYGSYEELLADPEIEAVYNPLPNDMHLDWSTKAAEAGKHVLCEKPLALNAAEAAEMIAVRDRTGVLMEEAFMVRNHPQWLQVRTLVRDGEIGELRAVQGSFAYMNVDPDDIRNKPETGGGTLYDQGSYLITLSRFVFEDEPRRVVALMDRDEAFGTDRLTSALLDFPRGQASIFCTTQAARYQRFHVFGTEGWIAIEIPVAMPPETAPRIWIGGDAYPGHEAKQELSFGPVNQYTLQGDRFSRLIRTGEATEWPLETALGNMAVIDALFRSAENGGWEAV